MEHREEIIKKLESHTHKVGPDSCWLWLGGCDGAGYGSIHLGDKQISVHRLSAHLFLGLDIDDKKQLALHKDICFSKACWNPSHLYIGTHKENTRDMDEMGRAKRGRYKTHCPKGHEYTPENTRIDKKGAQVCRECNRLRYYK